ncbi:MAG: hypothetical protein ONB24_00190 [candidate division KSB1 bacterium]|nr:hypothetical protein [candidate division KSB1 bacterium]
MKLNLICFLLGMSVFTLQLRAENRIISVFSTTQKPAEPAVYELKVAFDSPILPTSRIEIVFPSGYNVSGVTLAASDRLGGVLPVSLRGDTLVIDIRGVSATLLPGEEFDIKLATLLNPIQQTAADKVVVMLKQGNQEIERAESLSAAENNESKKQ